MLCIYLKLNGFPLLTDFYRDWKGEPLIDCEILTIDIYCSLILSVAHMAPAKAMRGEMPIIARTSPSQWNVSSLETRLFCFFFLWFCVSLSNRRKPWQTSTIATTTRPILHDRCRKERKELQSSDGSDTQPGRAAPVEPVFIYFIFFATSFCSSMCFICFYFILFWPPLKRFPFLNFPRWSVIFFSRCQFKCRGEVGRIPSPPISSLSEIIPLLRTKCI